MRTLISAILLFFTTALSAQVLSMPGIIPGAGCETGVFSVDLVPNNWINVADHDNLSFGDSITDQPFSISFWLKSDATGQDAGLVTKHLASNLEWFVQCRNSNNRYYFRLTDNDGGLIQVYGPVQQTTSWINIICTYNANGSNTGMFFYENNVDVSNGRQASGDPWVAMHNTNSAVEIGRSITPVYFDGHLKDVVIWNIELNASQRAAIYNGGVPPCIQNLNFYNSAVAVWEFNNNAFDTSLSGAHDGTESGGIIYSTDVP